MKRRLLLACAAMALIGIAGSPQLGLGHEGEHFSAGEPGDAKKPARTVLVTMRESDGKMLFMPDHVEVTKGEQIKFVIRNSGALDHEFVLADTADNLKHAELMKKFPDMEHADPNAKRIAPNKTDSIVWKFSKAGTFEYSCLIPGHRESGMIGTIVVK